MPFHANLVLVVEIDNPDNVKLQMIPCHCGAGSTSNKDSNGSSVNSGHTFSKWFGIASYGTKLFCAPRNASSVLVIDAETEAVRTIPCGVDGDGKWRGIAAVVAMASLETVLTDCVSSEIDGLNSTFEPCSVTWIWKSGCTSVFASPLIERESSCSQ